MKKEKLSWIIAIVLFVITILLFLTCFYLMRRMNQSLSPQAVHSGSFEQERKIEGMQRNFLVGLVNDRTILNDSLEVYDLKQDRFDLSQVLDGQPSLIVRISETHCEECITFLLNKVMRLFAGKKYEYRIILLASYYNRAALKVLVKQLDIRFRVLQVEKLPLFAETYQFPYCFVTDSMTSVGHVFVPDKHLPELSNQYFEKIRERYFDSQEK